MKTKVRLLFSFLLIITVFFGSSALTGCSKTESSDPIPLDNVVAHPDKFEGKIDVAGRVAKVDAEKTLLVLGCEDVCVAMPVKVSGTMPKEGSDVIVRSEIKKDADGRYLFEAESVRPKK